MSSSPPSQPKRPLRVLYVDDQEMVRSFAAEYLRQFGHEVETASDGLDGWEKFRQAVYDMVITDLEMPHPRRHRVHPPAARIQSTRQDHRAFLRLQ